MSTPLEASDSVDSYRVLVFCAGGASVLLERRDSKASFPEVLIPRYCRPAHQITCQLRKNWGVATVLLFSGLLSSETTPVYYAALEMMRGDWECPPGHTWYRIDLALLELQDEEAARCLQAVHSKASENSANLMPFARYGWMLELQEWIRMVVGRSTEISDFQQLNGCETFSLVRFDTSIGTVWYKAVASPNLHEFPITLAVSKLFPGHVPKILASDKSKNAWLMASGGPSLRDRPSLRHWISAVRTLAIIQAQSTSRIGVLLEAGCRDARLSDLTSSVDAFFAFMAEVITKQEKTPPNRLTPGDLDLISTTLKRVQRILVALGIPDTLGHSDLNPGNILLLQDDCTFTDWAEAHVGQPFLTFEYLMAYLRKDCGELKEHEDELRQEYVSGWETNIAEEMRQAMRFGPLVALYAYAVSGDRWRDPEQIARPGFLGYLRGLTRRMKYEADVLEPEMSCRTV
jgi:hypothetical protein